MQPHRLLLAGFSKRRSANKRRGICRHRRLLVEALEQRWLLDGAGPRILSHTPDEVRNDTFDHIDVSFNEAIDPATFTVGDVAISAHPERLRDRDSDREDVLPALARDICLSWIVLGDFELRENQDPCSAWEHYRRVLAVFLELWNDDPESAQTRTDLAAIHYRIGAAMHLAHQKDMVLEGATGTPESHFDEARKLREELAKINPTDLQAKIEWAVALARCGQSVEAEGLSNELLESLLPVAKTDPPSHQATNGR